MPAVLEEVVLRREAFDVEDGGPQREQTLLDGVAWTTGRGRSRFDGREGLAVDLADARERQLGQGLPAGRHHGRGEPTAQGGLDARDRRRGTGLVPVSDHVGVEMRDETAVVRPRNHGAGRHARLLVQEAFDLAELDAVAVQLDLVVESAEDLDADAGHQATEVTGMVVPGSPRSPKPDPPSFSSDR